MLTTNVWLDQEWDDELLAWDPKKFGGIERIKNGFKGFVVLRQKPARERRFYEFWRQFFETGNLLRIPCDKIWLPDIVLYNK